MTTLSQYVYTITDQVFLGYVLTALPLVMLRLSMKKRPHKPDQLITAANIILLTASCLFLLFTAIDFLSLTLGPDNHFKWRVTGFYWYLYWLMLALRITPQLYWIKKYRHSYKTTLLLFLLCGAGIIVEPLVAYLTGRYQDSRPSAWIYNLPGAGILFYSLLFYLLLLLVVVWVRKKTQQQKVSH